MGAYNKVNGVYACQSHDLHSRNCSATPSGFRGLAISDWGGVQDKRASVAGRSGHRDAASPNGKTPFVKDVLAGRYDVALIDQAVLRILSVYQWFLENPNHGKTDRFRSQSSDRPPRRGRSRRFVKKQWRAATKNWSLLLFAAYRQKITEPTAAALRS
ncbi:MAG: hypothetical protein MZU97_24690 [Bacillus subtilis]|nr:hypothetical protein [Bacillus subtilis]